MRVYVYADELMPMFCGYLGFDLPNGTFKELDEKLRDCFNDIEHLSDDYSVDKYGNKIWHDKLIKPYEFKGLRHFSNYEYGLYYQGTRKDVGSKYPLYHIDSNVVAFEQTCVATLLPDKQGNLIKFDGPEAAKKIGIEWDDNLFKILTNRKAKDLTHPNISIPGYWARQHLFFNEDGSVNHIEF